MSRPGLRVGSDAFPTWCGYVKRPSLKRKAAQISRSESEVHTFLTSNTTSQEQAQQLLDIITNVCSTFLQNFHYCHDCHYCHYCDFCHYYSYLSSRYIHSFLLSKGKKHVSARATLPLTTVWFWHTQNTKVYSVSTVTHFPTKNSTAHIVWILSLSVHLV